MLLYKSFEARVRKVTPSNGDLDIINSGGFAVEEVKAEDIFCGSMALCNNELDRSYERFPEGYLKRFADTIVGKSVMRGHDYRSEPVGRFYDAEVRKGTADHLDLVPAYYMMANDPLVPKVKAGILKGVSIGFEPDKRICDLDGKDYDGWWNDADDDDPCHHIAGRDYDGKTATITYGGDETKVEALEGSFVWLGCQHGAETLGQNQQVGRQAKSAFFAERAKGGRSLRSPLPNIKEKHMPKDDKGGEGAEKGSPSSPTAEEKAEALRLTKAGESYFARIAKRIETRYAAMEMEDTGKAIVDSLKAGGIEALEKAEADADRLFEKAFGKEAHAAGKAADEKDSAGDAAAKALKDREFNPLRYRMEDPI